MTWQRYNVQAAVDYLNKLISAGVEDCISVRDGLNEVLYPKTREFRLARVRELDQMDANSEKASGRIL